MLSSEVGIFFPFSLFALLWVVAKYSSDMFDTFLTPSIAVAVPEFERFLPWDPLEHVFSLSDVDEWKISLGSCNWEAMEEKKEYNFISINILK